MISGFSSGPYSEKELTDSHKREVNRLRGDISRITKELRLQEKDNLEISTKNYILAQTNITLKSFLKEVISVAICDDAIRLLSKEVITWYEESNDGVISSDTLESN